MSGYASKDELLDTIRHTITSDYNRQSAEGLPTDLEAYNFAGICRDLGVSGDRNWGWRYDYSAPPMVEILRNNLRKVRAS